MILPSAPTLEQKYLYLDSKRKPFYLFATISSVLLFGGIYVFTWANPELLLYGVFASFVFLYLAISYLTGLKGKDFDIEKHFQVLKNLLREHTVDVFLPVCGEPIEVLENTWNHVKELDWPAELLKVHVLDDSASSLVKEMAERFGFTYHLRDNRPTLKKAGNVRAAFAKTSGEFILILDADFCPRPDFLNETVPYMRYDEKIAIVQTPQFFEVKPTQTWVEQGAGYIQELFYRLIQVSRNTWGASICVGSCALYRREALEVQGGTYPIEHSEDLHTGFSMLQQGYRLVYIPIVLSMGVCPETLSSFWTQQYRWCTGSTSLATNKMFWKQKLTLMARLSYLSGMGYYVATALAIWLSAIPAMLMVWFYPDKLIWYTIVFYGPSFLFGTLFTKWWTRANGSVWDGMKIRQVSYFAHFAALKDRLLKSTMQWIPTGTATTSSRFVRSRYLFWAWNNITFAVIISGAFYNMKGLGDYNFYPTIFFTTFYFLLNTAVLRDQT